MTTINAPTLATGILITIGTIISIPILVKGFSRRGTGVKYERNFMIQRAPQVVSLFGAVVIFLAFLIFNHIVLLPKKWVYFLSLGTVLPHLLSLIISWVGVTLVFSGLVFMIGGWISLKESFSTDAELLGGHTLHQNGLLKYVMHPAYSGIVQLLTGASLVSVSPVCLLLSLLVVAPIWLRRAKYEEQLLIEHFGDGYLQYAKQLGWRRFIPAISPWGI